MTKPPRLLCFGFGYTARALAPHLGAKWSIIATNRDKLEMIANALLEYETLEGSQVEEIVRTGKFTPPPPTPKVDPPSGAQAATTLPEVPPKPVPPHLPGLGNPAPAAA